MKLKLSACLMLFSLLVFSQENFTISGTVKDDANGELVFGASVFLENTSVGGITNAYGFYSLTAPKGTYNIVVSYLGYTTIKQEVVLDANQSLVFELKEDTTSLDEVVITAEESEKANIRDPQMGVSLIKSATIKQIPAVLGEVDVVKSIQMLPGVTNNGEGSNGFNVRGGAVDQNLVLLDEAIIFNESHLFGFFSVFNADVIKDVKLYKGNIPANYGGRVSSVLDIRQKDGNSKDFEMNGGIGLISSRLSAEGPLFKSKGSFILAGRSSYAHLFLKLADQDNTAYFYDFNAKGSYEINQNNRLYLSGYFGRDVLNFDDAFANSYGNTTFNLRWSHVFNDKLFSNLSFIYGNYNYQIEIGFIGLDWTSSIKNMNAKYDFKYYLSNKTTIDFGASAIRYNFNPGDVQPIDEDSSINEFILDKKRALEAGLYANVEHKLSDKLNVQAGLRFSMFNRLGGQPIAAYTNDQPVVYNADLGIYEEGTKTGEIDYDKSESIANFSNFEPRLGLAYQLSENSSVKLGYSRVAQYLHLLSNTANATPLDVWTPSGSFIDPQMANQYSAGYFKELVDGKFSIETEVYYKTVDNRIDYIDGSNLIANNNIETQILQGESRAYGLEFLFRKNKGKFTGWLAYTLSKSEQKTPGGTAGGPGINKGDWYNTPFDRTHDISLTGSYKLTNKWSFSGNFIFQTGRPVTYPVGQYEYEGLSIAVYDQRNANRLPSYNRLDLAATFKPNRKPEARWKGEWVFSIYNAYNRKNAASISFGQNLETGVNEATRTAIFGIVPSVTYNFKF
ncbi:TonB-dependent receptor [Tamlana sp. 2_MG-2023]|uniref:TonB-dependent receptor n=1 Tax=unclassified Tamlana TaxID=2614803 RepID=UPI0026E2789C|nr:MULTISPECIES: TonB-dependent receptor [unclassified Tamlana]MDO6759654.1 TonB-dependent receptor [Tamlana sp. 2_MG-2023]MDO6791277.1 TonB-dependent receptor [Tamlana sp. 1_MG-2023]